MIKVWGRITSINVSKVVWALRELGLEFERTDAGGSYGGLDDPDYVGMNPNAKIPTINDNGFILWESNAIVRYLAATYGAGTLWPTDPRERADSDRWMDWQCNEFTLALQPAFLGLIRQTPEQRNQQAVDAAIAKTAKLAQLLDKVLADREYLTGSRFTMGDIALGFAVDRWSLMPIERPNLPNVARWREAVTSRPSAQGILKQQLV